MSPFVIPLGIFAMVVLIVAITQVVKIRDKELEVQHNVHMEELDHRRRMRELELELERAKLGK
jgi:hypothetical protein